MDFLNIADKALLLIPIGIIGILRYSAWFFKRVLSSLWRDIEPKGEIVRRTIGVAVTVKGEPVETFHDVLIGLLREQIDQVNIVFDHDEQRNIAMVSDFVEKYGDLIEIRWKYTNAKGKRAGLAQAIDMVKDMDIIMCIDSDTILGEGVKESVLEVFSNPERHIGGVTVQQRVRNPSKLPHYMFDIRLKLRYMQDLPGQALGGRVSCLSGRCSAYLAEPLKWIAPGLLTEEWAGIQKTGGGDDKFLTTALHDLGYKTVVVTDATVYTRPEDNMNAYLSQSLRWARNSWFSDLRALFSRGWMWRSPILVFYTLDRFMSTFTMLLAIWFMLVLLLTQAWGAALILFIWWMVTRSFKIWPYLWETKQFSLILPYIFMTLVIAILKIHAFVTLWEKSWLTRGAKRGRRTLQHVQQLAYRGLTSGVILAVGFFVFVASDIWLADIPGLADWGNFYRPEDSGLFIEDDLVVNEMDIVIAVPENPSTAMLNTVKDTALRLNEEIAEYQGTLNVKWSHELTASDVEASNLLVFGSAEGDGEILTVLNDLYAHPQLGERLADAEPFASEDYAPIRFLTSPWNDKNHILMVNADTNMRYRLNGQTVANDSAMQLISTDMGAQYIVNDTPYGRRDDGASLLSGWDIRETSVQPNGTIYRTYGLTIPPGIVFDEGITVEVDVKNLSLLSGMSMEILVNQTPMGTVNFDGMTKDTQVFPVPAELVNNALANTSADDRLLTVTLIVQTNRSVTNALDIWQQLDHEVGILLPAQAPSYSLAAYPYPFTFNTSNTPITVILPDEVTVRDVHMLIELTAQLGISAPDTPRITVIRASEISTEHLQQTNIITLGEKARQPFARMIDEGIFQKLQVSFYQRMPNDNTGLIHLLNSPWNPDNTFLVVSSEQPEGYEYAVQALVNNRPLLNETGYVAFVDQQLTVRPVQWSGPLEDLTSLYPAVGVVSSDPANTEVSDTAADPTAEPTTDPAVQPTTDPAAEPTAQPTAEPTTEPVTEPTSPPVTQPPENNTIQPADSTVDNPVPSP